MTTSQPTATLLWAVGDPDRGPGQFAADWFTAPGDGPVYTIGTSDPARDWPQIQPGPLDARHGFRPATITVLFDAPGDAEQRWHELRLDAIASHGPCPDLHVDLAGQRGTLVLEPERADRSHGPTSQSPIAAPIHRRVALPPGVVRAGRNELAITTTSLDQPDGDELRSGQLPRGWWFGSALSWCGLSLHTLAEPPRPAMRLTPLPLYTSRDGELHELVDLVVRAPGSYGAARADIVIGDHADIVQLDGADTTFGDLRARLAVPAFDHVVPGRAVVRFEGTTLTWEGAVRPARRWTLHVIPHVHLDIGYTDLQAKVTELHSRNVERVLGLLEHTPDYSFTIDGSFILQHFLRTRDRKRSEQTLQAIRDGRIGVNAFYALFLSGIASLEECYRAAYFTAKLRREHGLPISYANLTDVPTYPSAIPSIVAALGLDTFFGIANHTRGGSADSDSLHLLSPLRWIGPDGASVLTFFADSYSQLRFMCADPPTLTGSAEALTRYVNRYDRDDYLPDDLPIMGTHADNEDVAHGYADIVRRWNERYAYPRLRFSTISDYADAVRGLLDRLPVLRGDGGSYWEDGVGTQARAIATYRRAQALLPTAEALSALVGTVYDGLTADIGLLDTAWERLLIGCEHTWTSAHATVRPHSGQAHSQIAWKVGHIEEGWRLATDASQQALSRLAEQVTTPRPGLLVFNSLPWTRDAEVEIELDDGTHVETPSGEHVPINTGPLIDGLRRTRVLVRDIPPLGYRALAITERPIAARPPATSDDDHRVSEEPVGTTTTLDTRHYRVELDPRTGRLMSLTHRDTGRQLADLAADYALGEVLYVSGGGTEHGRGLGVEATTLFGADPHLPPPQLTVTSASMRLVDVRRTPWGNVLETEGAGLSIPSIHSRWHFPDGDDRVELTVTMRKQPVLAKESVYVAFPFAIDSPTVRYDRQQGWVDPAQDHHPGACNEWFTITHALTLTGDDNSIAWTSADAPLFTLGDVVQGRWPTRPPTSGTVLSWVMNNYWFTNTPASQDGTVVLHYAFRPSPQFDPVGATRLGRELRTTAIAGEVTVLDKGDDQPRRLPPAGSLLRTALPDHVDATVLAGRYREGVLVRLRELAGRTATVTIWHPTPAPAASAHLCAATEEPRSTLDIQPDGALTLSLAPYQVVTLMLASDQTDPRPT